MAGRSNWDPFKHKIQTSVTLLFNRGCKVVSHGGPWQQLPPFADMGRGGWASDQGLRFIGAGFCSSSNSKSDKGSCNHQPAKETKSYNKVQDVHPQFPAANSANSSISNWMKWFWGSLVSVMLPFWSNNWDGLRRLEGTVEKVAEEVEVAAEVVEKVATAADKALAEVANQLPDNTKLKEAAQVMEHASEVAAQDAHLIQNIIHKVDDVKQDFKDLESMVEPVFDKGHQRPQ